MVQMEMVKYVATFKGPHDICSDLAGNMYVAESEHHIIRKIAPDDSNNNM